MNKVKVVYVRKKVTMKQKKRMLRLGMRTNFGE